MATKASTKPLKDNKTKIKALVEHLKTKDPKLHEALTLLNDGLSGVTDALEPANILAFLAPELLPIPQNVLTFTYFILPTELRLNWTSNDPFIALYEIREGTVWATAAFRVRTPSLQADLSPTTTGVHTYLIKTINRNGIYSDDPPVSLIVAVDPISSFTVNANVVDNTVLLYWTIPFSPFAITYYQVEKNTGLGYVLIGKISGTFISIFEQVSGTYTYAITPVDVAGNLGPMISIQATIDQPTDFELTDTRISTLNGTRVNVILQDNGRLLCCESDADSWDAHFTTPAWASPQDQVSAGFPIYIQPDLLTGSYEETIDYGVVLPANAIALSWSANPISGSVGISTEFYYKKLIGDPFLGPFPGPSNFITDARYVKFKFNFTPADNKSLVEVWNIRTSVDVKKELDGGTVHALASDVAGTVVTFNKHFMDIDSLTGTARMNTSPIVVIIDFVDVPNPTQFKVLTYDSTGLRVDCNVDWKARGIVM